MIKAVKVFNTISILLFAAILLLVYAYLPISVDLKVDGVKSIHKQTFFYYAFGTFVVVNFLLRIILTYGTRSLKQDFVSWLRFILFIINFYLTTLVGFVGVINNTGHINPSSYAYLNYLGPFFLIVWVFGLIFFLVRKS